VELAAAMLKCSLHALRQRETLPHHYIVARHSLQAFKDGGLRGHSVLHQIMRFSCAGWKAKGSTYERLRAGPS
jgi:hypothetical protein